VDAIRPSIELRGRGDPEADVVVPVVRRVVVAAGGATVLRVVVPRAAAVHAVRALTAIDLSSAKLRFPEIFLCRHAARMPAAVSHGAGTLYPATRPTGRLPPRVAFF